MPADAAQAASYSGACHCGAVQLTFRSANPLAPRGCGCSFCRKHGGRWVSDAEGTAVIRWDPASEPVVYRFGTETADFILCRRCGVCVAAVDGGSICVLNLNAFDDPRPDIRATPMDFDGESIEQRGERRRRLWTPTEMHRRSADAT